MTCSPGIVPGAEPFFIEGGQTAVLLSHGFTGTPQSMRWLGEELAGEHGFTVSCPLLPGHGTTPQEMARTHAADWLAALDAALHDLHRRSAAVFLAGLSMGGTLVLSLAARYPGLVRGVATINGAILGEPDPESPLYAPGAPEMLPGIGSDIKDPAVREVAYDLLPVASLRELHTLLASTRALLPQVSTPLLILQSRDDHVVPPASADYIYRHAGTGDKELVWLDDSYHVATLDYDKERIAHHLVRFIQAHLR